jgi:hypothetical protein
MPDFAPNFTPRIVIKYSAFSRSHSQLIRCAPGTVIADAGDYTSKWSAIQEVVAPILSNTFDVVSASFCAENSDVFLPIATPSFTPGALSDATNKKRGALSMSVMGRTVAGLRAVTYWYGTGLDSITPGDETDDFRVLTGEDVNIANIVAAYSELSPSFVGNDGEVIMFYNYVNVKYNDNWVKKFRRGA